MSAFVVRDVTAAPQSTLSSISGGAYTTEKSSITSFQKVLEEASEKESEKSADGTASTRQMRKASRTSGTSKASKTSKTVKSEGAGGSTASGTTTLKNIFKRASEKYDISYDFLVSVAKAESDFNTKCVSSAGAKGIMQLMPDECREFHVSDPYDAEQNIMAAAKLLKAHLKKYDGNYTLAAAAYNAGSGAVSKYGGVPPYTETQNYVKKIRKYMKEGVTVPNKTVRTTETATESSEGSGGAKAASSEGSGGATAAETASVFDEEEKATKKDLQAVTVAVGSGADKVIMSYGAYLKYLELGTAGVG